MTKFKIGDMVKVIKIRQGSNPIYRKHIETKAKILQIMETFGGEPNYILENIAGLGFTEDELALAKVNWRKLIENA